jgi:hypothetical protein
MTAIPPASSPCRRHSCSREHADLVRMFRSVALDWEMAAERVAGGYETCSAAPAAPASARTPPGSTSSWPRTTGRRRSRPTPRTSPTPSTTAPTSPRSTRAATRHRRAVGVAGVHEPLAGEGPQARRRRPAGPVRRDPARRGGRAVPRHHVGRPAVRRGDAAARPPLPGRRRRERRRGGEVDPVPRLAAAMEASATTTSSSRSTRCTPRRSTRPARRSPATGSTSCSTARASAPGRRAAPAAWCPRCAGRGRSRCRRGRTAAPSAATARSTSTSARPVTGRALRAARRGRDRLDDARAAHRRPARSREDDGPDRGRAAEVRPAHVRGDRQHLRPRRR